MNRALVLLIIGMALCSTGLSAPSQMSLEKKAFENQTEVSVSLLGNGINDIVSLTFISKELGGTDSVRRRTKEIIFFSGRAISRTKEFSEKIESVRATDSANVVVEHLIGNETRTDSFDKNGGILSRLWSDSSGRKRLFALYSSDVPLVVNYYFSEKFQTMKGTSKARNIEDLGSDYLIKKDGTSYNFYDVEGDLRTFVLRVMKSL